MKIKNTTLPKSKIMSTRKPTYTEWKNSNNHVYQVPSTTVNKTPKSVSEVSNTTFVKAWMVCKTNRDVAKKLGLTPSQTTSRASFLRAKGVNLPKKINAHDPNSIDALNKLIAKYTGK